MMKPALSQKFAHFDMIVNDILQLRKSAIDCMIYSILINLYIVVLRNNETNKGVCCETSIKIDLLRFCFVGDPKHTVHKIDVILNNLMIFSKNRISI